MCRQVEAANAEQQVETTGQVNATAQVEQAGAQEQEQNPSTSEHPDIPTLKSEERVAKKVVEFMQAAGQVKTEEPKKKPKQIRNEHLLSKMDEILTEVRKLQL